MKKQWFGDLSISANFLLKVFALGVTIILCTGCHIFPPMPNTVRDMGPRYKPSNIYRQANGLPSQLRRVAVLPLVASQPMAFSEAGLETLSPLICPEVEKRKRFEIVPITPDELRQLTGRKGWRADEPLPADFFKRLSDATGCDGVLFSEMTRFQPYQPVAVGWKLCLVAIGTSDSSAAPQARERIIWCADEVLDAGEPGVANAARDYYGDHLRDESASADSSSVLSSPSRFGQYSLATLLETLPTRVVASR